MVLEILVKRVPRVQAREKSTKNNFLGPETARRGAGLPREGVVAEKFVPFLESLPFLGFEERNLGCPGNFAGMSRTLGCSKICAKKFLPFVLYLRVWRKKGNPGVKTLRPLESPRETRNPSLLSKEKLNKEC